MKHLRFVTHIILYEGNEHIDQATENVQIIADNRYWQNINNFLIDYFPFAHNGIVWPNNVALRMSECRGMRIKHCLWFMDQTRKATGQ